MVDRIGQQLGNYRLLRLLGKGGFAEVYLGEHIYLKTQSAIKLLQTKVANQEDLDSFLKEAQTIARLVHPHIVRVLDFGVDGETPFLAMDYAQGGSLRQRHPRGTALPLATIIPYVKQVAEALQYAHDAKLVHRDIKPENMLVGRHNEILLGDFGTALIAQSSHNQSVQEVSGTVTYMSPEQIQGKPRPASDQYSLGIVVYEWLYGECPFYGSVSELCTQHMSAPLPPLHKKVPMLSPAVAQVVTTALAKDSRQRFDSVQAFASALEQASRSTSVSLSHPSVMVPLTETGAPSNRAWTSMGEVPAPANGEHSSGQVDPRPRVLLSSPGETHVSRRISRSMVVRGLAGLAVVGVVGGVLWLKYGYPQPGGDMSMSTPTPVSTPNPVSAPAPRITSVSPIRPAQSQSIIIAGRGFGTRQPFTNTTSNYLSFQDYTRGWQAGYKHNHVGVTVSAWTDKQIEVTGFSNYSGPWTFQPGDLVAITVWNPQTHAGPALFTTTVVK